MTTKLELWFDGRRDEWVQRITRDNHQAEQTKAYWEPVSDDETGIQEALGAIAFAHNYHITVENVVVDGLYGLIEV